MGFFLSSSASRSGWTQIPIFGMMLQVVYHCATTPGHHFETKVIWLSDWDFIFKLNSCFNDMCVCTSLISLIVPSKSMLAFNNFNFNLITIVIILGFFSLLETLGVTGLRPSILGWWGQQILLLFYCHLIILDLIINSTIVWIRFYLKLSGTVS